MLIIMIINYYYNEMHKNRDLNIQQYHCFHCDVIKLQSIVQSWYNVCIMLRSVSVAHDSQSVPALS